jgi:hypothetical protein
MGNTYIYRTESVAISTAAGTTFTHGLGIAPAAGAGEVRMTMRTSTGVPYVITSNSQIVVIGSSLVNVGVDLVVQAYHSIIQ